MGMFDYVKINCPICSKTMELQSKAGPCVMKTFYIPGNAPLSVIADMQEDGKRGSLYCKACCTPVTLVVQTLVQVVVNNIGRMGKNENYP